MVILHEESERYITETLGRYVEEDFVDDMIIDRPIIHMYARKDTTDTDGNLLGYCDSLFCEIHIYDPSNRKKYIVGKSRHDAVHIKNANVYDVKIFKDGSTMLTTYGKHMVSDYQSLELKLI